jgi:hypothetical protein
MTRRRRIMKINDNTLTGIFVVAVIVALSVVFLSIAYAQQRTPSQQIFRNELGNQTVYRDSLGRTIGTGTVDSSGTTVFRDQRGRSLGTGTTDSSGTTVFRDSRGRSLGSVIDNGRR